MDARPEMNPASAQAFYSRGQCPLKPWLHGKLTELYLTKKKSEDWRRKSIILVFKAAEAQLGEVEEEEQL